MEIVFDLAGLLGLVLLMVPRLRRWDDDLGWAFEFCIE
jgi:hypothetical protein